MSSRTALVTGAGRRIGAAIAKRLAANGARVVIHCHASRNEADAVAAEIGTNAAVVQADLSNEADVDTLIAKAATCFGPLDVLINNASTFTNDDIHRVTWESWHQNIQVNAAAPLFLSKHFAAQAPDGAVIVNILDQKVLQLNPDFISYTMGKVALQGLTTMLAMGLAPKIRVNGIAPGLTLISGKQTPERFAQAQAAAPLGYSSTPEEIASGVQFILDTPAMTGSILAIDGGESLVSRPRDAFFHLGGK
ncbi:SDR family oxidoreductase [Lacibacterium aquatile]|uniref:SDR family oxidoreductase n=1 Tax=Lacibacterium aquatile TaxID=1168082 RepID=A0ABW5DX20_9PROT